MQERLEGHRGTLTSDRFVAGTRGEVDGNYLILLGQCREIEALMGIEYKDLLTDEELEILEKEEVQDEEV